MSLVAGAEAALFADTLACDDAFPLALRVLAAHAESADAVRRSEVTLRALGCLDESRSEDADAAENVPPRLEAKVDLILGLLAALAAQQHALPGPRAVRWSRHGFRLTWNNELAAGTPALCSVYLAAGLPLPIDLPVRVLACEPSAGAFTLWLKIVDVTPALQASVERELFRRHRRLVHERRSAGI